MPLASSVAVASEARVAASPGEAPDAHIVVRDMDMAYGSFVLIRDLNFTIRRGDIFVIMGGSGCGKSTLMRQMIGLKRPARGQVLYDGASFWDADPDGREQLMRRFGVLYQQGALWSSMTLAENIGLPLGEYTGLSAAQIREIASLKLALVGLAGFEDYYPSEISGGMRKRAGLARAMAMDPEVLFFDEPSAGLDPISSRRLDDLILELRDSLGGTVVMVTHELPSIFAIANNSVFLDPETKSQLATGDPHELLADPPDPKVAEFLTRGGSGRAGEGGEAARPEQEATSG
jgi:phospholipid/cholesterol/gamma-HCH transport system ATP-binding protein